MNEKDFVFHPFPLGESTKEQIQAFIDQNPIPPEFTLNDSQLELIGRIRNNTLGLIMNMTITQGDGSVIVGVDSAASTDTEKTVSGNLRGCMSSVQIWDDSAFQHGVILTPPSENQ